MPENNNIMSLEGQLVGMPLAGPESFSQQQLDYLKRALGVDETVLWENASGAAPSSFPVTLSEVTTNFETIRFYFRPWSSNSCVVEKMGDQTVFMLESNWVGSTPSSVPYSFLDILTASGTQLSFTRGTFNMWSQNTLTEDTTQFRLFKVVGIHRIAGGN